MIPSVLLGFWIPNAVEPMFQKISTYFSLVKFSHTLFALPFAALGFTLGRLDAPNGELFSLGLKVLLCMVFARNTAMAFNRLIDAHIDKKNPRTAVREIPAGILRPSQVKAFVTLNALAFMATTFFINPLCFFLSPVALAIVMGYSYTKRFTPFCHLILGLGLALAPIGAYMAMTGASNWIVIILGLVVMTWVGGFDIIYALQDETFDKEHQLYSIPAWLGGTQALVVSRILHVISTVAILAFAIMGYATRDVNVYWLLAGVLVFMSMLLYQHSLVKAHDLRHVNLAFFTTNGIASVLFGTFTIIAFSFV
jgi:4-hydroxybenzoate polyprenyltransferase